MLIRQERLFLELLPRIDKIEFKNIAYQDKHCKAITEYTGRDKVHFRECTRTFKDEWFTGVVHKNL